MLENGQETCNCKKTKCVRHGNCAACLEYHSKKERPPYCKREKKPLLGRLLGKDK